MRRLLISYLACVFISGTFMPNALAQKKIDARMTYERCWASVPMIGTGTLADPKRPLYAPLPSAMSASSRTGILGYTLILSDDGKTALVEFVARDRSASTDIL